MPIGGIMARDLVVKFRGETDNSVKAASNETQQAVQGVGDAADETAGKTRSSSEETQRAIRGIADAADETASRSSASMGVIAGVAGGVAAKMVDLVSSAVGRAGDFFGGAVMSASDLFETLSKAEEIFGQQASEMEWWAATADRAFGLSQAAALDAAAGFGDMFSQIGFSGDEAAAMSRDVVQLAADLGSFNNLETGDVLDMISASMRGEYDSLQRVIPNINAARIATEALALSGKSSASDLSAQDKAIATLAVITGDASRAAGDFERTSGGAANMQKIFAAQVENLKSKLGQELLPVLTGILSFVTDRVMPGLDSLSDRLRPLFDGLFSGASEAREALLDGWQFSSDSDLEPSDNPVVRGLRLIGSTAADVRDGIDQFRDGLDGVFGRILPGDTAFAQIMGSLGIGIRENIIPAWNELAQGLSGFADNVAPIIQDLTDVVQQKIAEWGPTIAIYVGRVTEIVGSGVTIISGIVTTVGAWLSQFWSDHGATIMAVTGTTLDTIIGVVGVGLGMVQGIASTVAAVLQGDWSGAMSGINSTTSAMTDGVLTLLCGLIDIVGNLFGVDNLTSKITAGFASAMSWINTNFIDRINGVISDVGISWSIPRIPGYESGGYTGFGSIYEPAGVVHKGEVVWSQRDVAAWGGPEVVDSMRRWRGYQNGGIVETATSAVNFIADPADALRTLADEILAGFVDGGVAGAFIKSLAGLPDKIAAALKDKLGSIIGGSYQPGAGVAQWRDVAVRAMTAAGLPLTYLPLLMHRMEVESGGNPNAINLWDINAQNGVPSQGLMQTIPPTFAAYAGQYFDRGITDPFANIYAAIKYTLDRYGLDGIAAAWGGTQGYDSGGWLKPGLTLAANMTGKPEAVLTAEQWSQFIDKMERLIIALSGLIGRPVLDKTDLATIFAGIAAYRGEKLP